MFQYAAGKSISLAQEKNLMLDTGAFRLVDGVNRTKRNLDILDFKIEVIPEDQRKATKIRYPFGNFSKLKSYVSKKIFNKYYYGWHPELYQMQGLVYLDGYFQSDKYSERIKNCIKRSFQLKENLYNEIFDILKILRSNHFAAVHVRRGDYFSDPAISRWHGVCDAQYYNAGIRLLKSLYPELKIALFSDDVEWCRKNIDEMKNVFFVSDYAKKNSIELRASQELILMSSCKHFLISNSTFSWWAQYLSEGVDKLVISPSIWNRNPKSAGLDLISSSWHTINTT